MTTHPKIDLPKAKVSPQFTPLPPQERAAAKKMSKELDSAFSRTQAKERLKRNLDSYDETQRADARTQRKIVGDLHALFISGFRGDEQGQKLLQSCAKAGIKSNARTSMALLFVRYELRGRRPKPELTSRWASVIRQALLDEIKPGELTEHLSTPGQSIKAMAAKLARSNRAHKGEASRPSHLAVRCNEKLHKKLTRYCSKRPCWARIEREKPGRFTIVKVSRHIHTFSSTARR